MIIVGIIASFRKQGEINVSKTVLPAPAAPAMSCKGKGIPSSQLSGISGCRWDTASVAPGCELSTCSHGQECTRSHTNGKRQQPAGTQALLASL